MAMQMPRQLGWASMMKSGAQAYSGLDEAVYRNISACKELVQIVQTSFGPRGMNKMVINHVDRLYVTNDAATIIKELDVQHPAAKLLVAATQQQDSEMGDGTGMVLCLAGELLDQGEPLLRLGLHPSEIISGYEKACTKALQLLEDLEVHRVADLRNVDDVAEALYPVICSKQPENAKALTRAVANACVSVLPENANHFNVDNVRVVKFAGQSVGDSDWQKGMVFKRSVESAVTTVRQAKVVVYSCAIDTAKTETKGTVLIKSAKELLNFNTEEESQLEEQIKAIASTGVKVLVAGSSVGDLALNFCNKYDLMVVRVQSKFDLRRLCKSVGAVTLARMGPPMAEEMGYCEEVFLSEIGGQPVTVFKQGEEESQLATVVVRGSSESIMDDVERAIDDGVNVYKQMTKDSRFVAGAGAAELELSKLIQAFGETTSGLDQYAIKSFAKALEVAPRIWAAACGADSTEVVAKLCAAHQSGSKNAGLDVLGDAGNVLDAVEARIFDHLMTKHWAIRLATHAACTVLSVDQIIMAKVAGGPKPRTNPDWDEDR